MLDPQDKEKENPTEGGSNAVEKSKRQINDEYFRSLEKWLYDIRMYKASCDLFTSNFYFSMFYQLNKSQFRSQTRRNNAGPQPFDNGEFNFHDIFNFTLDPDEDEEEVEMWEREGKDFIIPPLWKRFAAEVFDFILLFMMKLAVTYIAVDFFDFVNLNRYETTIPDGVDYTVIVEITSEILILELLHRLIVCVYEGLFLYKGLHDAIGGATPGKSVMGIKVVSCNLIRQGERRNMVRVIPATDIGLGLSFARACMKNLVLALLIPICFPFFFNKFNRSSYDILCHTLVVEERHPRIRNQNPQ